MAWNKIIASKPPKHDSVYDIDAFLAKPREHIILILLAEHPFLDV